MTHVPTHHGQRKKTGKIHHRIWQWSLFVFGVLFIFYAALLNVFRFATPYLQERSQQITAEINTFLPYPIAFGEIKATHYFFYPILKLHNVQVFNAAKTTVLWQINDLNVGVDFLRSLLHWRFELGAITIKGLTVAVKTNPDGSVQVGELVIASKQNKCEGEKCNKERDQNKLGKYADFSPQLEKMLMLRRIALEDITLIWNKPDSTTLTFSKVGFKLTNNLLNHKITAEGQVLQEKPRGIAPVTIEVNFRDEWWRFSTVNARVLVKADNLNFHLAPDLLSFFSALSASTEKNDGDIWKKIFPQRGEIVFLLHNVNFKAEEWFAAPVDVLNLSARIGWQNLVAALRIQLSDVQLSLPDLAAQGNGAIRWNKEVSSDPSRNLSHVVNKPDIDLEFSFSNTQPNKLINYFPTKIMHQNLVDWLQRAFTATGNLDGTVILRGNLANFPFVNRENTSAVRINSDEMFKAEISLDNIDLLCNPYWPLLKNIQGRALFTGKKMEIIADTVKTGNVLLHNVNAVIPDLLHPILTVTGQTRAPANLLQEYVKISPLRDTLGKYLGRLTIGGQIGLGLKIVVPLYYGHPAATAEGNIRLQKNSLFMQLLNLQLEDINGEMQFFNEEITAPNLTAKLLDQPVALHVATVAEHIADKEEVFAKKRKNSPGRGLVTEVTFTNMLPLALLQKQFSLPSFAPYAQGNFSYQGILKLPHEKSIKKEITLNLASNLRGMKINSSPLFSKTADALTDFNARFTFMDELTKVRALIRCGDKISAVLAFASDNDKGEMKFSSGLLRFGVINKPVTELPTELGLTVIGKIDKVNWEEWRGYLFGEPASATKTTKKAPLSSLLSVVSNVSLHIGTFNGFGQIFAPLHIDAESYVDDSRSHKHAWLVNLRNAVINGQIIIPHDIAHETMTVNLQKLYLVATKDDVKQEKSTVDPRSLPPLNVMINDLHYGSKVLGRVEIQLIPAKDGLDIDKLTIKNTNFNLAATGVWQKSGDFVRSTIQGKCSSSNFGAALKQLDFTESLDRGAGVMNFVLSWPDAFFAPAISLMDGNLSFEMNKGRIIHLEGKTEAELGIGRLLNIISLQSLPRRLTLDFSDLVKSGFSFDLFKGNFKLTAGDAVTNDTELSGSVAQVKMSGRVGFGRKDYDMNLTVFPHITSSIPMVVAVAGGPVIGAAAWVADKIIGGQVSRVVSHTYKINGSWLKPDVKKV